VTFGTRIAVLSPHLDDAALSIGAYLHQQASAGAQVVAVTVLANDPAADVGRPGAWDARCGFSSAAAAALRRRDEDLRAWSLLGGIPVWLPFGDETYGGRPCDDEVWAEIARAIGAADVVLVPGYPLTLPDHRFVARLVLERRGQLQGRLGFYAEQPYAAASIVGVHNPAGAAATPLSVTSAVVQFGARTLRREAPMQTCVAIEGLAVDGVQWRHQRTSWADRRAKRRAVMSYRSQLRPIGLRPLLGAWLYEVAHGGEAIGWA
jgi:LmbE family N-acetylglucosaminyl deacetylase